MLMGAVLGTAIGVWFLASLSVTEFQLWIGVLVVIASIVLSRFTPSERPASGAASLGTGVASGLMNGAFAIPGPPVILYVIATMTEATQSRAFLMMFFWCSSIVSLAMFALAGLVTPRPFQLLWVALPAMWLGNQVGDWAFHSFCWRGLPAFRGGVVCFDRTDHLGESHLVGLITASHYLARYALSVFASRDRVQFLACRGVSCRSPGRFVPSPDVLSNTARCTRRFDPFV